MDKIQIEILDDGTISIKTDSISKTNHISADQLLEDIEDYAGGKMQTTHLKKGHVHHHHKNHVHQH